MVKGAVVGHAIYAKDELAIPLQLRICSPKSRIHAHAGVCLVTLHARALFPREKMAFPLLEGVPSCFRPLGTRETGLCLFFQPISHLNIPNLKKKKK